MTSSLHRTVRLGPLGLFLLLAAGLVATEYHATHRPDLARLPALPSAVAFDLLIVLPGLAYWLLVRRGQLPRSLVAAAFGGGLALSHWLLPTAGSWPLLRWAGRVAAVGEVATVAYAASRLRRVVCGYQRARTQSADFMENLLAAGQPVLGGLAAAVMTEVAVVRYALLGAWAPLEAGPGEQPFSTYRQSGFGALLATLAGLTVVELTAAHLVVAHWHPRAAWVLTGLSAYALLWLLAHWQAVRRRPVLLTPTALVVRAGFGWRAAIELPRIADLQLIADVPPAAPGLLNVARLLLVPPNVLLTLAAPQLVRGPFGVHRVVSQLAFYVDEPAALARLLAAGRA